MTLQSPSTTETHHGWYSKKADDQGHGYTEQTNIAGERVRVTAFGASSTEPGPGCCWDDATYRGEFVKLGGDDDHHGPPIPRAFLFRLLRSC